MLQRFPIRVKLFIALAVPLFALMVVAVFKVVQTQGESRDTREQASLAESALGPGSFLSKVEDERNAAAVYLMGLEGAVDLAIEVPSDGYAITDETLADLEQEVRSRGGEVEAAYGPALEQTRALADIRTRIDDYTGERNPSNSTLTQEVFDAYSELMTPFFDASKSAAVQIDDTDLRRGAELIDLSARQTDLYAKLSVEIVVAMVATGGIEAPDEVAPISGMQAELLANEDSIENKAAGDYRGIVENLFNTQHVAEFPQLVQESLDRGAADIDGLLAAASGPSQEEQGYTVFRNEVAEQLQSDAEEAVSAADLRVIIYVVLATVALLMAALSVWLVSRSITRPLRALTRQATDMANNRLPDAVLDILDTPLGDDVTVPGVEPVHVNTRDEVADVADALNTVQDSALDLAVEQAVLRRNIADSFVNLGRRNQNLLGRQLDFITELEHNETDPDTLANLFRLDHLATRMRRNAESLLVLAGIDPPRKWAAPVRITDAIRAALGEVEDYQRVTVRAVEPATILGSAAADLAHLLAELIENALIFSPPDQTVEIRGRVVPMGLPAQGYTPSNHPATSPSGVDWQGRSTSYTPDDHPANPPSGYTLSVIDAGLGMPPDELARANRRLAGAESFTIAPSKYLGHYVAGNLAARHSITVTLHGSTHAAAPGSGHGITATINLPPPVLTELPDTASFGMPVDRAPGAPELADEELIPLDAAMLDAGLVPPPSPLGPDVGPLPPISPAPPMPAPPMPAPALAPSLDLPPPPPPGYEPSYPPTAPEPEYAEPGYPEPEPGYPEPAQPEPAYSADLPPAPAYPEPALAADGGPFETNYAADPEPPYPPHPAAPADPSPLFPGIPDAPYTPSEPPQPAVAGYEYDYESQPPPPPDYGPVGPPPSPLGPPPGPPGPPPPPPYQPQPQPVSLSDLQLDPLPPPVDPAGTVTAPMPSLGGRPDRPSDLPQLSSPHLRVTPGSPNPARPPGQSAMPSRPPAPPTPTPPLVSRTPAPRRPLGGSDAGPDRTSGGLVKRPPRQGATTQPARPSEDLLQTLATYTTHLHRQIDTRRPLTPPTGTPGSTFPAFNPTPPPGTPAVMPGAGQRGGPRPHLNPVTHGDAPDHTASGLARRVRGAQLPQTQPIGLRRGDPIAPDSNGGHMAPAPESPPDNPAVPGTGGDARPASDVSSSDANTPERSAKDVYSFLSSFSAGVQRGLDEARRTPNTPEEDQ